MDIDEDTVVHDFALGRMDETHPAHIGSQLIHFVEFTLGKRQCLDTVFLFSQVQNQKIIGSSLLKFMRFLVDATNLIALIF